MLSRELVIELHAMMAAGHRELWTWLTMTGYKDKSSWPGWGTWRNYCEELKGECPELSRLIYEVFTICSCFGCMWDDFEKYLATGKLTIGNCNRCLLIWPEPLTCSEKGSLFSCWESRISITARIKAAYRIANLPFRKIPKEVLIELC